MLKHPNAAANARTPKPAAASSIPESSASKLKKPSGLKQPAVAYSKTSASPVAAPPTVFDFANDDPPSPYRDREGQNYDHIDEHIDRLTYDGKHITVQILIYM